MFPEWAINALKRIREISGGVILFPTHKWGEAIKENSSEIVWIWGYRGVHGGTLFQHLCSKLRVFEDDVSFVFAVVERIEMQLRPSLLLICF